MAKQIYLIAMLWMGAYAPIYSLSIPEQAETYIKTVYGQKMVTLEKNSITITDSLKKAIEKSAQQAFYQPQINYWKVIEGDKLVGHALLDNVLGKSMPITFIVIFSPEGKIINSGIIKYREPIGGAVANSKWNKQFEGFDGKTTSQPWGDIDGISGATISVHSVTKGIRKLAILMDYLLNIPS